MMTEKARVTEQDIYILTVLSISAPETVELDTSIHPDIDGVWLPTTAIYYNLKHNSMAKKSRRTIDYRLDRLVELGLVEMLDSVPKSYYGITPDGRKLLAGDYDSDKLSVLEE